MIEDRKLVYNFNNHRVYYNSNQFLTDDLGEFISLTISAIELDFNYEKGALLSVTGFQPLIKATIGKLDIPSYKDGIFIIPMNEIKYQKGIAYDYFDFFPISRKYFMIDEYNPKLIYDEHNKRVLIGQIDNDDNHVKINKNIICGFDNEGNLKSLLLLIDKVIK